MKHEYADGSARYGTPPFPKLSPKEEAAGKQEPVEEADPVMPDPADVAGVNIQPAQPIKRKAGRPKKAD